MSVSVSVSVPVAIVPDVCCLCATFKNANHLCRIDLHLLDMIFKHMHIRIQNEEGNNICQECRQTVIYWNEFVEKCWTVRITLIGDHCRIKTENDICTDVKVESPKEEFEDKFSETVMHEYDDDDCKNEDPLSNSPLERPSKCSSKTKLKRRKSKREKAKTKITEETEFDTDDEVEKKRGRVKRDPDKTNDRPKSFEFEFKCHLCSRELKSWNELKRHCSGEHSILPRILCICGRYLSSHNGLNQHRRAHSMREQFKCDHCGKNYLSSVSLKHHYEITHMPKEEYTLFCAQCPKKFPNLSSLKLHIKNHHTKAKFPCDICGLELTSKSNVKAHKQTRHMNAKEHICDVCGKAFSLKGNLKAHRFSHGEERDFKCEKCDKAFKRKELLKIHLETHNEASIKCPKCPAVFTTRRNLRTHQVSHSNVFNFECKYCGKKFKRSKGLKAHMNSHEGIKRHKCRWCPKTFACEENLKYHIGETHPLEYVTVFKNESDISTDKEKHPSSDGFSYYG